MDVAENENFPVFFFEPSDTLLHLLLHLFSLQIGEGCKMIGSRFLVRYPSLCSAGSSKDCTS